MAVLDRMPVEDISIRARDVRIGHVVLALLALVPFMLGWTAGKTVLAIAWLGLAVKAGWRDARKPVADGGG